MVTLAKPVAGDADWTTEINQNWTDVENAVNAGLALSTIASTPSQITANQNNYAFAGGTSGYIFQRLSSDASRNVTGISGGSDGKHYILANVGSFNIVLTNEDTASTAGNRIITGTGASITLAPNERVDLIYDNTTARWRCSAKAYTGGGASEAEANKVLRYERFI